MPTKPRAEKPDNEIAEEDSAFLDFLATADEYTPQERIDDVLAETAPEPPAEEVAVSHTSEVEHSNIATIDPAVLADAMAETKAFQAKKNAPLEDQFRELVPEWTERMGHSMFQVIRMSDGTNKVSLAREAPGNYEG